MQESELVIVVYLPEAIGRAIHPTSMMSTFLRQKWIWTRSTTIGCINRTHLHFSICTPVRGRKVRTVKTRYADAVLVRVGYHPVVAGPGYDIYYLNFLAGSSRAMALTEDPQHVWIRSSWRETDPRLPLV